MNLVSWSVATSWPRGHDRALTLDLGEALVVAIADGAGGQSGAARAAERVLEEVARFARAERGRLADAGFWCMLLAQCDAELHADVDCGLAAAAVACVIGGRVVGASVGDCGVWAAGPRGVVELSASQRRRPLLGDAGARPWPLDPFEGELGALALGTDGVLATRGASGPVEVLSRSSREPGALARALADLGRLDSGEWLDDVTALAVCFE